MTTPDPDFTIPQYATKPWLEVVVEDIDLSGASVTVITAPWKGGGISSSGSASVSIEGEDSRLLRTFASGDTSTPGLHRAVFITDEGLRFPSDRPYYIFIEEAPGEAG